MTTPFQRGMDLEAYLRSYEGNALLRFITCGSVDDGKSTFIGRLLHDTGRIHDDHLRAIEAESRVHGTQGGGLDLALVVDGLKSEREQGITIDVAWRYFASATRSFIIADCPGHEQYTRNMATGASHCQLAISLIDARHGVTTQTRRHAFIARLMGIRHVIAAVNKMDLVNWSEARFREIEREFLSYAARLGVDDAVAIPISALAGDNVARASQHMPWYSGSPVMTLLETVPVQTADADAPLRMCVQGAVRPDLNFRGLAGTISSGWVKPGDRIRVMPSGRTSRVRRLAAASGDLPSAHQGQAVTLVLEDEIDCSRGDVIACVGEGLEARRVIEADVVWMHDTPLVPGSTWLLRCGTATTTATVSRIRWESDIEALGHVPSGSLRLNAVGRVALECEQALPIDDYDTCQATGSFILIERLTNATAGAGVVRLERGGARAHWDTEAIGTIAARSGLVSAAEREARFLQKPGTVLLFGRPGAGKTGLAHALQRMLFERGHWAVVLDGQSLRATISRDLEFDAASRSENLRRAMDTSRLLQGQGCLVIASLVAPEEAARQRAAALIGAAKFASVYVRGGRAVDEGGTLAFDEPLAPDLVVDERESALDGAARVFELLRERGFIR